MERKLIAEISPEIIKETAEMLDMGMLCFIDKYSGELEYYPDPAQDYVQESQEWEETITKIDLHRGQYYHFEPMSSFEGFRMMEDFINGVNNEQVQDKLFRAIAKKKPFRNFGDAIFEYPEIRNQWFDYKLERGIEQVKNILELARQ